jgi:hypothetical protein
MKKLRVAVIGLGVGERQIAVSADILAPKSLPYATSILMFARGRAKLISNSRLSMTHQS